jgi:hypothetical protein
LLTPKLKKGDKVVMHTCMEAPYHHGRIWTCDTDEFETNGRKYGLVFLEGFSGSFATEYLQYVDVSSFLGMYIDSLGKIGNEKYENKRRKSD